MQFSEPKLLADGLHWAEGPAWHEDESCLFFSEVRADRLCTWTPKGGVKIWQENIHYPNGNAVDEKGHLVTCETTSRRVVRRDLSGGYEILAERFEGQHLNSPNDVIVHPDGRILFTDPHYGYIGRFPMQGPREMDFDGVFSISTDGKIRKMLDSIGMPNGLSLSPDGQSLFVADSSVSHFPNRIGTVLRFPLTSEDPDPADLEIAVTPGYPDGIHCDRHRRLWTSAGDGVHLHAPEGTLLARVRLPEPATNLTMRPGHEESLLITTLTSLYEVEIRPPN